MDKKFKGLVVFLLLLGVAASWFAYKNVLEMKVLKQELIAKTSGVFSRRDQAVLNIYPPDGDREEYKLSFKGEVTAFDLLERSGVEFEASSSEAGVFIESVGGVENGEGNRYWMYYVDGEMPSVACDKKKVEDGSVVEFKFESNPF